MTEIELLASVVVAVQAIGTGWLTYMTKHNACGGPRCIKMIQDMVKTPVTHQDLKDARDRYYSPDG